MKSVIVFCLLILPGMVFSKVPIVEIFHSKSQVGVYVQLKNNSSSKMKCVVIPTDKRDLERIVFLKPFELAKQRMKFRKTPNLRCYTI